MTTPDPRRRRRSPRSAHPKGDTVTTTAPPACDHHWHAGACLTDDLPPEPVGEPHECRQPAGHPPPCRCHWCGTTTEGDHLD